MLRFLLDEAGKRAVQSLQTDSDFVPGEFTFGDVILDVTVARLSALANSPSRLWNPEILSGWLIRVGLGLPFQPPLAGVMTFQYVDDNTGDLPYNISPANLETVLNNLAQITSAGGVTVTGEVDYYIILFNENGAQPLFVVDVTQLAPLCKVQVGRLIAGTGDIPETQVVHVLQDAAAMDTLLTFTGDPGVTVDILTVGGGGQNQKVRFTLNPAPYDGVWTLSIGGQETDLAAWNISGADLQTLVEALSTVGTGNVSVIKEDETNFLLGFKGTKANTNMGACIADGSSLRVMQTYSGPLDLRSPALALLFGADESITVIMEIKGTPPSGLPYTLYRQPITLNAPVIQPDSSDFVGTDVYRLFVVDLTGGEESIFVTFSPNMSSAPTVVTATLAVADGGSVYSVTPLKSTYDAGGFTLLLGAPANAGDQIQIVAYE